MRWRESEGRHELCQHRISRGDSSPLPRTETRVCCELVLVVRIRMFVLVYLYVSLDVLAEDRSCRRCGTRVSEAPQARHVPVLVGITLGMREGRPSADRYADAAVLSYWC